MKETFRLLNRHGMRLWLGSLMGGLVVLILLLIPHLFIYMVLGSKLPLLKDHAKQAAASPVDFLISGEWLNLLVDWVGSEENMILIYGCMVLLLTVSAVVFYFAGLIGSMRSAVLDDSVSPGHFFSCGLRYMVRLFLLFLVQGIMMALPFILFLFIYPSVLDSFAFFFTYWMVMGVIGVFGSIAFCHAPIIMFTEGLGAFHSFVYGFKTIRANGLFALASTVGAALLNIAGLFVIFLLSFTPWLILQLFEDGAIALIVGPVIGVLLFATLSSIPVIVALGFLYTQYLHQVQGSLFPEDQLDPVMHTPDGDDKPKAKSV